MAFLRRVAVVVGPKGGAGFTIDGLKIAFNIEKTDSPDPNTGKIQLYNLSKDTSNRVTVAGNHVTLKAGYDDETIAAIFFGDVLKGERKRDGRDFVTELQVQDSRIALMSGQVSVSYSKGTDALTIVQSFIGVIGKSAQGLENIPAGAKYPHGYCFIGMAQDGLRDILNRYGLKYTMQDEKLVILKPGAPSDQTGLRLTPESGLLTVPQPVSDKTASKDAESREPVNKWSFATMLFPQLLPGAACSVESSTLKGAVEITKAVYSGDNRTGDFKIEVEAEVL
jgi:hypothetical protein